MTSAK